MKTASGNGKTIKVILTEDWFPKTITMNNELTELMASAPMYIGTKQLKATYTTLGKYYELKEQPIPEDADPADNGYIVQYQDGYISWSPADVFEEAYRPTTGITFGLAVEAMKRGHKLARTGWNGVGMYAVIMPGYPNGIPANEATAKQHGIPRGTLIYFRTYFQLKTADGSFATWAPSGSDTLAEDWFIVE